MDRVLHQPLFGLLIIVGMMGAASANDRDVAPAQNPSSEGQVIDYARAQVIEHFDAKFRWQSLEPLTTPRVMCDRPIKINQARVVGDDIVPRPRIQSLVFFECNGSQRAVPVWFAASVEGPVLRALKPIQSGHVFGSGDFEMGTGTVSRPRPTVSSLLDGTRYRAVRSIEQGDALSEGAFELAPDVVRGQELVVMAREGAIGVSTNAVSREDGMLGDIVKVKRAGSEIELEARLISPERAEVVP